MLALDLIGVPIHNTFSNGKDMAHSAFLGEGSLVPLLALSILNPFVTSMALGAGGSGGFFIPSPSTDAIPGGFLDGVWTPLWPGTSLGTFAMVGAAAMLSASMQAPLAAIALVLERTHTGLSLLIPMMTATVIATTVSHHIDGFSIYTARLPKTAEPVTS
jgi:H+/Cl- antiporter ClcA